MAVPKEIRDYYSQILTTVSTPKPSVSTLNPSISTNSLFSGEMAYNSERAEKSSTPSCPSAYACGQDSSAMKSKIEDLEKRLENVEETATEKRSFIKKAESLLMVFKIVLIATPITIVAAMAMVQYIFYGNSELLNIVTGVIGLTVIAECIWLPIQWRGIEKRIEKVEERLETGK